MNDQELADKIVALGVGTTYGTLGYKLTPDDDLGTSIAAMFVTDWRVAGALMEKCYAIDVRNVGQSVVTVEIPGSNRFSEADNISMPRAIIEACVDALE